VSRRSDKCAPRTRSRGRRVRFRQPSKSRFPFAGRWRGACRRRAERMSRRPPGPRACLRCVISSRHACAESWLYPRPSGPRDSSLTGRVKNRCLRSRPRPLEGARLENTNANEGRVQTVSGSCLTAARTRELASVPLRRLGGLRRLGAPQRVPRGMGVVGHVAHVLGVDVDRVVLVIKIIGVEHVARTPSVGSRCVQRAQ